MSSSERPPAAWQRALLAGDLVVAARRTRGETRWVWARVLDAHDGLLCVRRYEPARPEGVEERMSRGAAVFPVSRAAFEAARRAGWPEDRRAVQALANVVPGGDA